MHNNNDDTSKQKPPGLSQNQPAQEQQEGREQQQGQSQSSESTQSQSQSQSQSPQHQNQQGQRRQYHVARRRSPSELTPLMVEQLALQQQIEMLQAQQQQILAQHHQFSQAGLLPPLVPQAAYVSAATAPFGQFASPPTLQPNLGPGMSPHALAPPNNNNNRQSPTHRRAQSSVSFYNQGGHARRHSLAISEAKKAAAIAQAKRHENEDPDLNPTDPLQPATGRSELRHSVSSSSTNAASFKFPSTPEQHGFQHGRSQSVQYPSTSRRSNQFQFPAREDTQTAGTSAQHQRSGSRNFDANWRDQQSQSQSLQPSPNFVPGHRARGSFNSVSSISQFYGSAPPGPGGQPSGQQQRKSLFTPYLPHASLPALLEEGRLVAGILRVNKKNRSDAYVSTDGLLDADIFVCGSKDRNRALEGDLVAVELLDVDEVWGSKREKEEKKKRRDATSFDERSDNTTLSVGSDLRRKGSLKQRPVQKKNDDVEVEGQSLLLSEEEELSDEYKPLYAGHVVAVIERIPGQTFSGTLGILRPSSQATKEKQEAERREKGETVSSEITTRDRPKIVWFKPTDKRVPLFAIPTEQAPKDFVENHEAYANQEFVASIKRWPITSLHPFGTLVEQLGPSDDADIQIESILRDNNYTAKAFTDGLVKSVADITPISETETPLTSEFEEGMIVGITGRKFCDMAIQIRNLPDRRLELAIHVADVSHFIKEGSALEKEARRRSAAVSLPQQEVELFPENFSKVASFEKGRANPAFSIVFEIDSVWDIVDTRISQSVVKPEDVIDFDHFKQVLESSNSKNGDITTATSVKSLEDYVLVLDKLSRAFRKNRLSLGTDSPVPMLPLLNSQEDDSMSPSSSLFDYNTTQAVISEIAIKVNCAVASHLYSHISSQALLRRQPEPVLSKIEAFSSLVTGMDLSMDTSSAVGLQKSLFAIDVEDQRMALETLLSKALAKGRYFVAGKVEPFNYPHYWLSVPLYTHFEAPLSRYADIIVQRQLRSVIQGVPIEEDINSLSSAAEYCNFKRESARNAQEQAIHLQLCQKISQMSSETGGVLIRNAIVIQVYESAFDVLIPDLGIEKRVHGDQLPLVKAEYNKKTRVLDLFWEKGVDSATFIPDDERKKNSGDDLEEVAFALSQVKLDKENKSMADELVLREEDSNCIQEIRALQHVPVLVRAQVGKGIPCITVRTINPFA